MKIKIKTLKKIIKEAILLEEKCPYCGDMRAYVGMSEVDCENPTCPGGSTGGYKYSASKVNANTSPSPAFDKLKNIILRSSQQNDQGDNFFNNDGTVENIPHQIVDSMIGLPSKRLERIFYDTDRDVIYADIDPDDSGEYVDRDQIEYDPYTTSWV